MKRTLTLLALGAFGIHLIAQESGPERAMARVKKDGGWMYVSEDGAMLRVTDTDTWGDFSDGLAKGRKGDLIGFFDRTGNWVITPQFKGAREFKGGFAAAHQGGLWGYIDKKGEWAITPQFDAAQEFDPASGMARVKKGDAWMYVAKDGGIMRMPETDTWGDFSEGLAKGRKGGQFGFFDKTGSWVIAPQFNGAREFKNGYAAVEKDNLWGIIDRSGSWVIQPQFEAAQELDPVSGMARVRKPEGWMYAGKDGSILRSVETDVWGDFSDGLAKGRQGRMGEMYGFFDKTGIWVIPPQFKSAREFKNGYAAVEKDNRWGFIDRTGNWIIQPQFEAAMDMETSSKTLPAEVPRATVPQAPPAQAIKDTPPSAGVAQAGSQGGPEFINQVYVMPTEGTYQQLEKQDARNTSSGGGFGGFGGRVSSLLIPGARSNVRLATGQHRFVIKVVSGQDPSDIIELVRFEVRGRSKDRYADLSKSSHAMYHSSSSEVTENRLRLSFKNIGEQVYEIVVDGTLTVGEYGFINGGKVFAFGIGN